VNESDIDPPKGVLLGLIYNHYVTQEKTVMVLGKPACLAPVLPPEASQGPSGALS
jgi:hypothetical protein